VTPQTQTQPQTQPETETTAVLAIAVTMLLWASAFVAIRYAGQGFSPGSMALGRLLIGTLALGAVLALRRERFAPRASWPGAVGAGFFWFALYTIALNWGERHVDASIAAFVVGIGPILVAMLGGWLLGEGFPTRVVIGLATAFAGTAVVGLTGGSHATIGGVGLCLLAAVAYAVGVVAQKPALRHASALQVTTLACAVGAVTCLPFAGQLVHDLRTAPGGTVLAVIYLGLFPTAVAFYTWAYALARTTAGKLGVSTYIVPVLVILLSWVLLDEFPGVAVLLGGALCLIGVAISRTKPRARAAETTPLAGEEHR
jgi:drug/metabolite transporter (DMT)-like permease